MDSWLGSEHHGEPPCPVEDLAMPFTSRPHMNPSTHYGDFVGTRGKWLSRNLVILTLVSLLQDAASELMYPLLPILVTGVLAAPPVVLGLVEGTADATAGVTRYVAGRWSDRVGRKPFIGLGYSLAAIGKVFVASALVWPVVLIGRTVDRFGKGIRSAPRDALIADSVPQSALGRAFGFHRAGDSLGAVIGPDALLLLRVPNLGFSLTQMVFAWTYVLIAIYGLFPAFTDGVGKAWISSLVLEDLRGRAQGVFQMLTSGAILLAGLWSGLLWSLGAGAGTIPLAISGVGAAVAAIILIARLHPWRSHL